MPQIVRRRSAFRPSAPALQPSLATEMIRTNVQLFPTIPEPMLTLRDVQIDDWYACLLKQMIARL